jgi:hypothetical protein
MYVDGVYTQLPPVYSQAAHTTHCVHLQYARKRRSVATLKTTTITTAR